MRYKETRKRMRVNDVKRKKTGNASGIDSVVVFIDFFLALRSD